MEVLCGLGREGSDGSLSDEGVEVGFGVRVVDVFIVKHIQPSRLATGCNRLSQAPWQFVGDFIFLRSVTPGIFFFVTSVKPGHFGALAVLTATPSVLGRAAVPTTTE